jgi:hypothetical protein
MIETIGQASDPFSQPTYLPRITRRDGRAIEEALAGPTLFDPGVRLDAAVVEPPPELDDEALRTWARAKLGEIAELTLDPVESPQERALLAAMIIARRVA